LPRLRRPVPVSGSGKGRHPLNQESLHEHSRTGRSRFRRTGGVLMARAFAPRQPGPQARAGRVMSITAGTVLMTVGAILVFALTVGSPGWLNLPIVGVILILAGALGLTIPRLARSQGSWYRRWVVPMLSQPPPVAAAAGEFIRTPGGSGDTPTLADDLLRNEHDPPI
jgi:hypothetical protein